MGKDNSMGKDVNHVINLSKCHPDALRGRGIKAPANKKARTSKKISETGRLWRESKAHTQANERAQRLEKRSVLWSNGSESTSSSDVYDVRRPSSQPPYCPDSQSKGEQPADGFGAPGA